MFAWTLPAEQLITQLPNLFLGTRGPKTSSDPLHRDQVTDDLTSTKCTYLKARPEQNRLVIIIMNNK